MDEGRRCHEIPVEENVRYVRARSNRHDQVAVTWLQHGQTMDDVIRLQLLGMPWSCAPRGRAASLRNAPTANALTIAARNASWAIGLCTRRGASNTAEERHARLATNTFTPALLDSLSAWEILDDNNHNKHQGKKENTNKQFSYLTHIFRFCATKFLPPSLARVASTLLSSKIWEYLQQHTHIQGRN